LQKIEPEKLLMDEIGWGVLETFSRVTNFYTSTASS